VANQHTAQEIDSLVTLLVTACEDAGMSDTLAKLLAMPDQGRRNLISFLIDQFRKSQAPQQLTEAFSCILDDRVAERAYEVIYQCKRKEK